MKAVKKTASAARAEMTVGDTRTTVTLISRKNDAMTLSIREWHTFASVELAPMEVAALVNSVVSAVYENEDRSFEVKDSDSGFISVTAVNWMVELKIFNAGQSASVKFTRDEAVSFVDHIHSFYE